MTTNLPNDPYDLRKVLKELQDQPGQYHETNELVDPLAELSGVYRYIGTGGTVQRPTQEGPAMMFNNIKGFPDARVLIGIMAILLILRFIQLELTINKHRSKRWSIGQPIQILIFGKSFLLQLTPNLMLVHILPLGLLKVLVQTEV